MSDEPLYQLIADFQVDNGQLDGLTPQEIFALGVEFGYAIMFARADPGFILNVNPYNRERIEALLWRHGRKYQVGDSSVHKNQIVFIVAQKGS